MYEVADRTRTPTGAPGFRRMFSPNGLTLGLFFPIEAFQGDQPRMEGQERLAARAEEMGFAALWFRDVPLRVPAFGDVGQVYDPFVHLAWIAARTESIALATGAVVLPLRHPLHTAKQAASVDRLSGGRVVLGVASGDRPDEFPAFGVDLESRGEAFRENLRVVRSALAETFPILSSERYGALNGRVDVIPKPRTRGLPMLGVGTSRQDLAWHATHMDGWMTYPKPIREQAATVAAWRRACDMVAPGVHKPIGQSLYIDLADDPDEAASPIHLGLRVGRNGLHAFLEALEAVGVAHVILNLKYGRRRAGEVLEELGEFVTPSFPPTAV